MKLVLVGGSGFLGRYLVQELADEGHDCVVLSRHAGKCGDIRLERRTKLVQADVYDPKDLLESFTGADVVINMAGILNEAGFGGKGFKRVHVDLTRGVIDACKAAGVQRLVHISALNAGKGKSQYLVTKGEAEDLLQAEQGLNVTILQPSVIFGPHDSFFNRFAAMLRWVPVFPLACPDSRMQPVFAGDVASVVASCIGDRSTFGRTYELAGPESYTLAELVRFTASAMGLRRLVVGLPGPVSRMQAMFFSLVPGKPFSLDNFKSLQVDCVSDQNAMAYFGIAPSGIGCIVPDYLVSSTRQKRLSSFRERARRQ
jgi:NADH dehydrogenase